MLPTGFCDVLMIAACSAACCAGVNLLRSGAVALGAAEASGEAAGELCGLGDVCAMTDVLPARAACGVIISVEPTTAARAIPLINVGMRGLQSGMRFSSIECLPLG
jgi:hypothetical protein